MHIFAQGKPETGTLADTTPMLLAYTESSIAQGTPLYNMQNNNQVAA